jgi:hypothetical protein
MLSQLARAAEIPACEEESTSNSETSTIADEEF